MISTTDFHTGITIELEGELYTVVDFQHVKPGKGAAFVRTKLKKLRSGSVVEKTFRAGEKVAKAHLEKKKVQYLYSSGDEYYFMDTKTYEQMALSAKEMGETINYLKENMEIDVIQYREKIIGVEVPLFVELTVTETDPGMKGNTVSGGSKPARLETGLLVQVPFFINEGDVIRVDTRTAEYMERA